MAPLLAISWKSPLLVRREIVWPLYFTLCVAETSSRRWLMFCHIFLILSTIMPVLSRYPSPSNHFLSILQKVTALQAPKSPITVGIFPRRETKETISRKPRKGHRKTWKYIERVDDINVARNDQVDTLNMKRKGKYYWYHSTY